MSQVPQPPQDSNGEHPAQLPAIPQPMSGQALAMPLPPAPWMEGTETKESFNLLGFLHSLRRRWLLGLGLGFLVASAVACLLGLLVPITSEVTVLIRVRRETTKPLPDNRTTYFNPADYEIFKQTQAELLRSPFVLNAALRKQGIANLPIVLKEPWGGRRDDPVSWLQRELIIGYPEESEILKLGMKERDRDQLVKLLNAIKDAYMEEVVTEERAMKTEELDKLKQERQRQNQEMNDTLGKIKTLAEEYGSNKSEQMQMQIDLAIGNLRYLQQERMEVNRRLREAMSLYYRAQGEHQLSRMDQPSDYQIEQMLRVMDPEFASLDMQRAEAKSQMLLGMTNSSRGTANPLLQSMVARLDQRLDQIKQEKKREAVRQYREMRGSDTGLLQKNIQLLGQDVQLYRSQQDYLLKAEQKAQEELKKMGVYSADLELLQWQAEAQKKFAEDLSQQIGRLQLEIDSMRQIEVIQNATPREETSWFMKYMQITGAWIVTLIGTVLGVAFWDYQSKRVNSPKEVTQRSDIRVVGTLPALMGRRAGGLLPMSDGSRRAIEIGLMRSIDSIRTSLLYAKTDRPIKVVLVTSALGQEGRTTVASQLAVSLARAGRRTLLVDGDVRNPQLHTVLGMPAAQGLCEVLRGEGTLDDYTKQTAADNLYLLLAGFRDANTDQFMSSPSVSRIFDAMRESFDFVVIDSGPVLTSPDAMLLGHYADTAVMSVRRDVSRLPKVMEASDRLRLVGIPIFGAVLNGGPADIRASELHVTDGAARPESRRIEQATT